MRLFLELPAGVTLMFEPIKVRNIEELCKKESDRNATSY
jgi:hypothetical protein